MLAFFTILHTGHESRKTSQSLQEQRCLQGSMITQEFRMSQLLQIMVLVLCSSSPFLWSITLQYDSASSVSLADKRALSLSCWIVLFNDRIAASFSFAILCHVWFSISIFLRKSSSSIFLFTALNTSSSFCLSNSWILGSYFLINNAICCFLCSRKANLNLSFYINKSQNMKIPNDKKEDN